MSSDSGSIRVRTRCVGGPQNGIVYDLALSPSEQDQSAALRAQGAGMLSDRYRLTNQMTTTGDRILVYIGEPPEVRWLVYRTVRMCSSMRHGHPVFSVHPVRPQAR